MNVLMISRQGNAVTLIENIMRIDNMNTFSTPDGDIKPFTEQTYEALVEFRDCFEPHFEKKEQGNFGGFF